MDTSFLILPGAAGEKTSCAVRLKAPTDVGRIPTHIILMIDISESMLDDNKLENVKKCCELLLTFLNDDDAVSLITFGESARIHIKTMAATEVNKTAAQQTIKQLLCDGCTNLSAGLGLVDEVCAASNLKTGLLILTDGHANRGISNATTLRAMISSIRERNTNLSLSCVAYGSDHNADLLRSLAEDAQGAYTIVRGIEDTAMAFGDTLGGLMSCAFQNVILDVPKDTIVHGPYKTTVDGERRTIHIGDVYAGTKPLILLDIPTTHVRAADAVLLRGNKLPELTTIRCSLIAEELAERDIDIDITRHRYTCAQILNSVRDWQQGERDGLGARIDGLEAALRDEAFNGHPVANMLRSEIGVLRTTLERAILGVAADRSMLTQHVATVALGRGFSSPMNVRSAQPYQRLGVPGSALEPMDPTGIDETSTAFQNPLQSAMSVAMRTASQQVAEPVTSNPSQ
jgi:Mg-chelatase subunit ChlD